MTNESAYYNAVALALQGDYRRIKKLRGRLPDWHAAFISLESQGLFDVLLPDPPAEYDALSKFGIRLLLREDPSFPSMLREIPDPPFGIYVRGMFSREKYFRADPRLAIVGTRKATPEGKRIAYTFAQDLCRAGFVIVSGLAFGIDAAAHEGALGTDTKGSTIAVLAGGLDSVFPATNEQLAENILAHGGAIISEYPIGEPPYARRFIERNRIVSGLSRGILIVEAPERSGALATARFAAAQNRDLFVVPGPIAHSHFKGSHALIRQGAELVTSPQEILEAYGIGAKDALLKNHAGLSPQEILILKALQDAGRPMNVDKIIEAAKLEPRIANQALSFLLMKNVIKEMEEGYTI